MIGRLVISDRNIFKVKSGSKQVSARRCNILSESHDEILIKTNKEFNSKDEYVKIDPNTNIILEGLGHVGTKQDDLSIYFHLYTLNWMGKSKYNKLWEQIDINFDLVNGTNGTNGSKKRIEYSNKVITIDPPGSKDLDDGFSFSSDSNFYYLDIHIADPVSLFDLSNPSMIKILNELNIRLQTCYIDSKLNSNNPTHLLPEPIVNLISLLEINPDSNIKFRRAISFCFKISKSNLDSEIDFKLEFTKLTNIKNYSYDIYDQEINLESNFELKSNLVNLSNKLICLMNLKLEPIDSNINTPITHRMIEIFMILTNWYGGNYLINKLSWSKTILRTQNSSDFEKDFDFASVPKYARPILSKAANYLLNPDSTNNYHYSLGIQNYAHISSPMRRFVDMINHLGFYQVDLETVGMNFNSLYNMDHINMQIKNYKKLSNGYDLVKFIRYPGDNLNPTNNKFRACLFDWELNIITNKIKCLLVLNQDQYKFIKIVSVELPQIDLTSIENLKKYMEFDIELYYNSNNFKSNKFPFSIKII